MQIQVLKLKELHIHMKLYSTILYVKYSLFWRCFFKSAESSILDNSKLCLMRLHEISLDL